MAVPFADVAFKNNSKQIQRQPAEVRIRQREYAHDVAVITLDYERGQQTKYAYGAPVSITWGFLPSDVEDFLGYVHHTEEITHDNKPGGLKVWCVGASYPCNQTRQRSYRKMMASAIVARIARDHHMSLLADPSSRYHRHIPQLGQSDWALAVRIAKDIGFTLSARQTTIRFQRRIIDTRPGRQPVFRLSPGVYEQRGAIYKITHKKGSAPYADRRIVQLNSIDDQGNLVANVNTGDPCDPVQAVFTQFNPPDIEPALSVQEGRERLSGLSGLNRFYVIANVNLSGNPKVRPGQTIALLNVNSDVDGYWWTGSVDHIITPTDYRMEAEIGRETIQQTVYVPPPSSDAGKPQIIDQPSVDTTTEVLPDSEYSALDDCVPVEALVTDAFGEITSDVVDPFESPARQMLREQRPRPTRRRGGCVNPALAVPVARLNGWRSSTSRIRTTS
jgi:hypothetical protein